MSDFKAAFHANETKVISLLSTNISHFLQNLPLDQGEESSEFLLNKHCLTSSHKAQKILCFIEEDDGRRYHELFSFIEREAANDPTSRKVASYIRASTAPLGERHVSVQQEG
jgi:hypothetical protein